MKLGLLPIRLNMHETTINFIKSYVKPIFSYKSSEYTRFTEIKICPIKLVVSFTPVSPLERTVREIRLNACGVKLENVESPDVFKQIKKLWKPDIQTAKLDVINNLTQAPPEVAQSATPAARACEAAPLYSLVMVRLSRDCPCGFVDITYAYEHRYLSIGGTEETIGTAGVALGTRSNTLAGVVSGAKYETQFRAQTGSIGVDFMAPVSVTQPSETVPTETGVDSATVAPALAVRLCEREGSCDLC